MKIVGKTTEGHLVIGGIFRLVDTNGLPFGVVIDKIYERNWRVSWLDFLSEAFDSGWNEKTVFSKCREGIQDSLKMSKSDKAKIIEVIENIRNFDELRREKE